MDPKRPARRALYLFVAALATMAIATSCASLQKDLLATSAGDEAAADIDSLEREIVPLDVTSDTEKIAHARALVRSLEQKGIKDAAFEARLAAWSGRLFLIEGKRAEAERLSTRSRELLPGDVPGMVLSARLERDGEKRLEALERSLSIEPSSGALLVEKAQTLDELRRYREAVAAFDAAFPLLPGFYEVTWGQARDRAWALRDLDPTVSDRQRELAAKGSISWRDAIEIAQDSGGLPKGFANKESRGSDKLFDLLVGKTFIPRMNDYAQSAAHTEGVAEPRSLEPTDPLDRAGAAWFLWHLFADRRGDQSLLTRYSARYRSGAALASPVPDVALDAPFFDSALGVVERELMALPDGVNFRPALPVSGAEFRGMLERCK
jgi:tetratricopeptide (TPR) repeat protein